jgi:starch synthase
VDATEANLASGRATGFSFLANYPAAFLSALQRALELYRRRPDVWRQLMQTGMRQDWSWDRSAAEYEKLYSQITGRLR